MSNIVSDLKKVLMVPIHKEGYKFIAIFAAVAFFLALFNDTLGVIGFVLTLWCAYFFRNPPRFTIAEENDIISPADGVINSIAKNATPPAELDLDPKKKWVKISVFLNVFDVHVNRVPISGTVEKVCHKEGEFLSANDDEASDKNERSSVLLKTKNSQEIVFAQVAGLVARRIVNELVDGQEVKAGELYGLIRFGSRADIYLPENSKIRTVIGQKMTGGETIIAHLSAAKTIVAKKKPAIKAKTASKKTVKSSKKS
jgi:phosphatidylserine decarboxylase